MGSHGASIELKVYDNGDHTCLVWLTPGAQRIAGCRGFAIRRVRKVDGHQDVDGYLHGAVGFSETDQLDTKNPWKRPVQRFLWWDYLVEPGDTIQYAVVPVVGPDRDHLALDTSLASPLTPPMKITGQSTPHISAYFNKGIVAAQWVSRALAATPPGSKIKDLVACGGNPLRNALSGLLRPQILSLLEDAKAQNGKIFAALYELNDPELIPALEAFGPDCHLILANGAFGKGKPDENEKVREQLREQVTVIDRMVPAGHFAHNKFVVFCDSAANPLRVLTGSTNWTASGLCTQANNGLVIDDPGVAGDYFDAWERLRDAGNEYTPELEAGNSTAKTFQVDGCSVTPWFAATTDAQDLECARRLIDAAQEGILFLFFNPGAYSNEPHKWTLLQNVLARQQQGKPDLYVRGVVNQQIAGLTEPLAPGATGAGATSTPASPVTLYRGSAAPKQLGHDVLIPHNIKTQFHTWEEELLGASMVNIHSKVIVLDPFGEHPVVMTGSHNLGFKASSKNDDNLAIVQGNGPLAAAYAINIIAIFDTYRWNNYVETRREDPNVWHGLEDNDKWQNGYLQEGSEELAEIKFWLGDHGAAKPAAGRVRSVSSA